jgi:hypothetical protein
VRRRTESFLEPRVELMFARARKISLRNFETETPQPRTGDEDEQRILRHAILREIGQALLNQILAR